MTDDLQKRIERQLLSSFIEPQVIAAILRDCQSEIASLQRRLEAAENALIALVPSHRSPIAKCWCPIYINLVNGHSPQCLQANAWFEMRRKELAQ